jgi:signal transduction histidine kinase
LPPNFQQLLLEMSKFIKQLTNIGNQVDRLLQENNHLDIDQVAHLKTIQNIIVNNLNTNRPESIFDGYNKVILEWARLNFTPRLKIGDEKDIFEYINLMLNLIIEEIEHAVVSRDYYEETLEELVLVKPDFVITTDIFGVIKFSTSTTEEFLGFTKQDLLAMPIQEIFEHPGTCESINDFIITFKEKNNKTAKSINANFLSNIPEEERIDSKYGFSWLKTKNDKSINVSVSVKRILNHVIDGYVYSFKEENVFNDICDAVKQSHDLA